MLTRISLDGFVTTVVAAVVLFTAGSAYADSGGHGGSNSIWGNVDCGQNPYPGCQLGAGSSSSRASGHSGTQTASGGSDDQPSPDPFSCVDDLVPYAPVGAALRPPDGQKASAGGWYVSVCAGDRAGTPGGGVYYPPVWVVNGPDRPVVTPAELARSAYNKLPLTAPTIVLSPTGQQLVNLPTWLAVTGWSAESATAGVPAATAVAAAVSVTATATPTFVVWSTGDSASVTCHGPGTIFTPGDDPAAASPTCGHTYRVSSAGQPGAVFAVTATVHWSVSWSGAGQAGTFPDLTTTATARVPVAESQALTTR